MQKVDSLEKTLMLGGIGGRERRGLKKMGGLKKKGTKDGWMASLTQGM